MMWKRGISEAGIKRLSKKAQESYQPFSAYEGEQIMYIIDSMKKRRDYLQQDADDMAEALENGDTDYLLILFNGSVPDNQEVWSTIDSMRDEAISLSHEIEEIDNAWKNHDRDTLNRLQVL